MEYTGELVVVVQITGNMSKEAPVCLPSLPEKESKSFGASVILEATLGELLD